MNCFIPDKKDIFVDALKKLLKKIPRASALARKILKMFHKMKTESFFTLPKIDFKWDKDNEAYMSMGIDIQAFCPATHFCFRKASDEPNLEKDCVSFFSPVEFKKDVKYIMLSATANEKICQYFFKDYLGLDVKYYYCKRAAYMGKVYQYADHSYSRFCLDENPDIIKKIKEWTGFEDTITFLKYCMGPAYHGKASGVDFMKGRNIDIIGTPHMPEFLYKLIAFTLGLDFDENDKIERKSKDNITEYICYRFPFTTFDDEVLRNVQHWIISSSLEQEVGRARLLRYDCVVNVFSDFPVSQAIFKNPEYDKKS